MNRTTVRTYVRAEQVPEVHHPYHKPNPAQRYEDYLRQRWEEGCYNARQLYRELLPKGYKGSLKSVRKLVTP